MSQLGSEADRRQEMVEQTLGRIGQALAEIEHDSLRVNQAIRRTGANELLEPVLAGHASVANALVRLQTDLRQIWEIGQDLRWEPP